MNTRTRRGKQIGSIALILAAVFALATCSFANVKVNVEEKGSYVYWFSFADGEGKSADTLPADFKGTSGDIDTEWLSEELSDIKLYVMNKSTGNVAAVDFVVPKGDEETKPIELKKQNFEYVRNVRLKIVAEDGAPVESAIVNITDGENTAMTATVTPADEGVALFHNVATGELEVKVQADGLKKTLDSDVELPDKRDGPGFAMDIKVAGDVDTLPVAAGKADAERGAKGAANQEDSAAGNTDILQILAGLMFLVLVGAIVFVVIKAKGLNSRAALKRMGVELPDDQMQAAGGATGAAAEPQMDPNVCEFCGQRKDAAGNCACSVTGGAQGASSASAPGVPRLIGTQGVYSGRIFELTSGSAVIGREATNDIALSEDTTISRRHAVITTAGGSYSIQDQGSSNGTFVNGAQVTEQNLTPGDEIQIGASKFRFEA